MDSDEKVAYTFEQWVEVVFIRQEPPSFGVLWDEELERPADWLLVYATRLFYESEYLLNTFTDDQLRHGFWSLPIGWDLTGRIWDQAVPWELRESCLSAMVVLFKRFFALNTLGDTCFMWWDFFRTFDEEADKRVSAAMFTALSEILEMEEEHCQMAALHGLGHLDHTEKAALIKKYLDAQPDRLLEIREYAQACIKGDIL